MAKVGGTLDEVSETLEGVDGTLAEATEVLSGVRSLLDELSEQMQLLSQVPEIASKVDEIHRIVSQR